MSRIDDRLKIAQAIPVVGPVVVSSLIVVASTIKMLAGAVLLSAGALYRLATGNDSVVFDRGVKFLKSGALNFGFSTFNIATFGIFAAVVVIAGLCKGMGKAMNKVL